MENGLLEVILATRDGGVWMVPILMFTLFGVGGAFVFGVLAAVKVRVPLAMWLAAPAMVLTVGAYGTGWGTVETMKAVSWAPAEMVQTLAPGGMSIALLTTIAALLCVLLIGVNTAWAAGVGGLVASLAAEARVSVVGALLGLAGLGGAGVVGLVIAVLLGLAQPYQLAAWASLLSVIPVTLVALRVPAVDEDEEDGEDPAEDERHRRREARVHEVVRSARNAAVAGLVIACGAGTTAALAIGRSTQLRLLATAPPELRETATTAWSDGLSGTVLGAVITVLALGIGLAIVLLGGRGAPRSGRLPWGLAAAAVALLLIGSAAYGVARPETVASRVQADAVDVQGVLDEVRGPPRLDRVGPHFRRVDLVGIMAVWQRDGTFDVRRSVVRVDGVVTNEEPTPDIPGVPYPAMMAFPADATAHDLIDADFGREEGSGQVLFALPPESKPLREGTWPVVEFEIVGRTGATRGEQDHVLLPDGRVLIRGEAAWDLIDPLDDRLAVVHVGPDVPLHRLLSYCTDRLHCQIGKVTKAQAEEVLTGVPILAPDVLPTPEAPTE